MKSININKVKNKKLISKCKQFAYKRANQQSYCQRDKTKQTLDFFDSILTECAVYKYLTKLNIECSKPNFTVYTSGSNNFDADLKAAIGDVHVKSFRHTNFEDIATWTYTAGDPHKNKDIHAYTSVDGVNWCDPDYIVNIYGFWRGEDLEDKYREPQMKKWIGKKICTYYEDIKDIQQAFSIITSGKE